MKKHATQNGSAHVIIIAILVIVLVGALGWIFWQNLKRDTTPSNTEQSSGQPKKTEKPAVKLLDGSIDKDFGTTLTFKYPETWQYKSSVSGSKTDGNWIEEISLTSPSKKYVVSYRVGKGGGVGGICIPEDTGTIAATSYQMLDGFPSVSYVEIGYKGTPTNSTPEGGYIGLLSTNIAKKLKPGDSICDIGLNAISLSDRDFVQTLAMKINISDPPTSYDQFKPLLGGEEYDQAKAILLSTTH
ncbi:hypothetical protein RAAC3_TM7C00001G0857 [Candidatus Saccharibacteria bacterium RAAC3_TM7_1]|nr:hypothetical protein RAAC3_TM7C00001G0857 [Candidatus Saccharibacteria bacterium RAAC3_TM7_1]HCZ28888.1 hypothetical protein [Candidatus Saccharibacteria bacterium]